MGPDKVLNFLELFKTPKDLHEVLTKMKNDDMKQNFFNVVKFLKINKKEFKEENFSFYSESKNYKTNIKKKQEYSLFERNEKKLIERLIRFFNEK